MLNRRKFIHHTLTLSASAVVGGASGFTFDNPYLSFDFHAHPGSFFGKGMPGYPGDEGFTKTIGDMNIGGLTGAFFSLVADAALLQRTPTGIIPTRAYSSGEGWKEYQRQMSDLKTMMTSAQARLATRTKQMSINQKEKIVSAFISVEGGDFLQGDLSILEKMYADGVRSMQLVHYAPSEVGDLQTENPMHKGLSAFGKQVVKKMNDLGMLIDVAHASEDTVKAVTDITKKPIMLSHSILKMEEDRPLAKRAITPAHAKMVASTGGVIGAWPSGFNKSFEEFVDNILRLVDVIGINHIGLGTDMDGNFKPVMDSYTQIPKLIAALQSKGLNEESVRKIMGGNAKRLLEEVVK